MSVHFVLAEDYIRTKPSKEFEVLHAKLASYREAGYNIFRTDIDASGNFLWVIEFEDESDAVIFKLTYL